MIEVCSKNEKDLKKTHTRVQTCISNEFVSV
jgi:hypothetical protein